MWWGLRNPQEGITTLLGACPGLVAPHSTLPRNKPHPKEPEPKGSPRGTMPTLSARGQSRRDKGRFPKEVMPELSQSEKPRTGGNTQHQGRFQSTYRAGCVMGAWEADRGKKSRSFPQLKPAQSRWINWPGLKLKNLRLWLRAGPWLQSVLKRKRGSGAVERE